MKVKGSGAGVLKLRSHEVSSYKELTYSIT